MKSEAKLERKLKKEQKELAKWQAKRAKPTPAHYLIVLAVVVTLIHIVDETISQVSGTIQSNVIEEFFVQGMGMDYNTGLSQLSFLSIFSMLVSLLAPIYKTLADKIGRKPLLVLNVLGFAIGMVICFWSPNHIVYIIGMCIVGFFTSHDMQVTYILESAPDDKRARFYGITKGIGTLGCVMLPILRAIFMGNDGTKWRLIFIVPAILGVVITLIVIISARETEPFLNKRIAYLETPVEERKAAENSKKAEKVGIGVGMKFLFKNKYLRRMLFASMLIQLPTLALSTYYQSIMHLSGMSDSQITTALFAYPFIFALFNVAGGYLADKLGRKTVVIGSGIGFCACFILFVVACLNKWPPLLVGALYALYISCFWASGDFRGVMSNELAPTRIRFSVTGASAFISVFVIMIGMIFSSTMVGMVENLAMFCAVFSIPCVLLGTLIVAFGVKETNGTNLDEIEE